jgi:hypothetical protein
MGTLGLCSLELSRTVLLGRFARGGAHNRDARLPREAGRHAVEMLVTRRMQEPEMWRLSFRVSSKSKACTWIIDATARPAIR